MTRAEQTIRRRIRDHGRITFAEFMDLALYGPGGYYAWRGPGGRQGDYYTSPLAHPLFGALLALQLEQLWRLLDAPARFLVAEPGAGDGRLAHDILAYARRLDGAFARALTYVAVDRFPRGAGDATPGLTWLRGDRLPVRDLTGCVLSNELVDSLPVHRVVKVEGRLKELYVTIKDGALVQEAGELSTAEIANLLESQEVRLADGWQAEVGLAAARWMADVAGSLRRGYVLTIDYGDPAERLYTEARRAGTLMGYFEHTPQPDPLIRIGRQDMTAHVNFTTLVEAGRRHGLDPVVLMDQRAFLRNLGAEHFIGRVGSEALPQRERQANLMAMRDLIKPEGLGAYRVLVQAKDAPGAGMACKEESEASQEAWRQRLQGLAAPLLTPEHLDLLAARYPHQAGVGESR
ncbi:MAG: SAM-dependent methyltransferase [Dehalococcoidia bacterium]